MLEAHRSTWATCVSAQQCNTRVSTHDEQVHITFTFLLNAAAEVTIWQPESREVPQSLLLLAVPTQLGGPQQSPAAGCLRFRLQCAPLTSSASFRPAQNKRFQRFLQGMKAKLCLCCQDVRPAWQFRDFIVPWGLHTWHCRQAHWHQCLDITGDECSVQQSFVI